MPVKGKVTSRGSWGYINLQHYHHFHHRPFTNLMSQSVDQTTAENTHVQNTPRSSFTFIDPSHQDTSKSRPPSLGSYLDEKLAREEEDIERYGGDDPREPRPKSPLGGVPSLTLPPERDPNMANWDGPDDPHNPQNWSIRRKWMITVVCIIMTVNV